MIKDVLYIPRMKCNLLSVGQLVEKNFSVVMKDGDFELVDTQNSCSAWDWNYGDALNKP